MRTRFLGTTMRSEGLGYRWGQRCVKPSASSLSIFGGDFSRRSHAGYYVSRFELCQYKSNEFLHPSNSIIRAINASWHTIIAIRYCDIWILCRRSFTSWEPSNVINVRMLTLIHTASKMRLAWSSHLFSTTWRWGSSILLTKGRGKVYYPLWSAQVAHVRYWVFLRCATWSMAP